MSREILEVSNSSESKFYIIFCNTSDIVFPIAFDKEETAQTYLNFWTANLKECEYRNLLDIEQKLHFQGIITKEVLDKHIKEYLELTNNNPLMEN